MLRVQIGGDRAEGKTTVAALVYAALRDHGYEVAVEAEGPRIWATNEADEIISGQAIPDPLLPGRKVLIEVGDYNGPSADRKA